MPRRKLIRRIGRPPTPYVLAPSPADSPGSTPPLALTPDELEAVRLCDLEGLDQSGAAARMGVSRATFQRLLREARRKVATAVVNAVPIAIASAHERVFPCRRCGGWFYAPQGPAECPRCRHGHGAHSIPGGSTLRIAFSSNDGHRVSAHFGRSRYFLVADVVEGRIERTELRENPHAADHESHHGGHLGHEWLDVLADCDLVVTRSIGAGAAANLASRGIRVHQTTATDLEAALADALAATE